MEESNSYSKIVKDLVDELKGVFNNAGLGGEAGEYKLLTQSFLYKFINDKFLYEAKKLDNNNDYERIMSMSDDEYDGLIIDLGNSSATIKRDDLIETIYSHQNDEDFSETFDNVLNDIAVDNNDVYSVETSGDSLIRLFDSKLIENNVIDSSQRNSVAKAIINKLSKIKFDESIFEAGFDFFSTIFEYMIKDYNKDGGGKYAEYYTPHSVAKIIAKILIGTDTPENVSVYDPSAGSGTLLMNLASQIGTDRATVYSQDISQKSANLLRLNLILNGLSHSIKNIVQGNTITNNKHHNKMDYIVSNPPFKLDFSEWRDSIESLPDFSERFFAGVPNVKKTNKSGMEIYDLFIQHILYSLSNDGKAAIVVPTGFLTSTSRINKKIREKIIDNNWLSGVVSMPSQIFATTSTSVSVLILDKTRNDDDKDILFVDASRLGTQIRESSNQRTVLSEEDEKMIIDTFVYRSDVDEFSINANIQKVKENNNVLVPGQYFPIRIKFSKLTPEEFDEKVKDYETKLSDLYKKGEELEKEILSGLNNFK
ncbi:SAM-dependent DNA methyltransferase [Apilactobacillus kunkeei]|uniref:class I SAM-dependent DNA methyltransferase n=1 Tax=Apilactobacillus kunkeei TaxID=148814 RepID=UPI00112BC86B|nr:class I SAM-dependent DNA methyltransferase [Apilactobacillus kunkeei]TPR53067.1 SAM-dependent DNA methyltransferase [Apilactobacillus kunkeei]